MFDSCLAGEPSATDGDVEGPMKLPLMMCNKTPVAMRPIGHVDKVVEILVHVLARQQESQHDTCSEYQMSFLHLCGSSS